MWKLDRLGRNTRHVLDLLEVVRKRGAGFRSLTKGLDMTRLMGTAMLTIMASFAQLEREMMIERTKAGSPQPRPTAATMRPDTVRRF